MHAHGDRQRACGRSLPDRRALPLHGEHGLELGHERAGRPSPMLADKDAATGAYRIPRIIYSDAFWSETVAYADLVLPDTTYLERWDCISLLDRPIGSAEGPGDAIRQPVLAARSRRAAVPGRADRSGPPARAAGLRPARRQPRYPGGYADYIVNHERKPGIGPLAGWRGAEGDGTGVARPTPTSSGLHRQRLLLARAPGARGALSSSNINRAYLDWAVAMGSSTRRQPISLQLYAEPLQRFRLAAEGHGAIQPPDELRRAPASKASTRCRSGTSLTSSAWPSPSASRSPPSPSGRWRCTTPGTRRTPGCGRSRLGTAST